jgi:hypothetical protein
MAAAAEAAALRLALHLSGTTRLDLIQSTALPAECVVLSAEVAVLFDAAVHRSAIITAVESTFEALTSANGAAPEIAAAEITPAKVNAAVITRSIITGSVIAGTVAVTN